MANTREIRNRIKSVQEIQHITRAMKMVAAAKLRKAQKRLWSSAGGMEILASLMDDILYGAREKLNPLMQMRGEEKPGCIVVTSDKGLCGGFNAGILKAALPLATRGGPLVLIGKKGSTFFSRRGVDAARRYADVSLAQPKGLVDGVTGFITKGFLAGEADSWDIVYNRFDSVYEQGIVVERIIPLSTERKSAEKPPIYLIEPSYLSLLDAVIRLVIWQKVYMCLLKSEVAEHLARMNAMENASDNAGDLIEELTLNYNRARQAAITKEIVEIVGGAEALAASY